jgi:hypothetical protein
MNLKLSSGTMVLLMVLTKNKGVMKNYFLLLFLMAFCSLSAQEAAPDCGWYGNKTVAQRNAVFPFNVAKKVVLVAYPAQPLIVPGLLTPDEFVPGCLFEGREVIDTLSVALGTHKATYYLYERKEITGAAIDQLSNIMLNYTTYPGKELGWEPHNCTYWPRNSVLFYDENNTLVADFGLCFSCSLLDFSPREQVPLPYALELLCPEFMKLLRDFFEANGVTYGMRR